VERNGLGLLEIVETQVKCAAWRDDHAVRSGRFAIGEIDGESDVRLAIARIQDARRFVGQESAVGRDTFRRNVAFGHGPPPASVYPIRHPPGRLPPGPPPPPPPPAATPPGAPPGPPPPRAQRSWFAALVRNISPREPYPHHASPHSDPILSSVMPCAPSR